MFLLNLLPGLGKKGHQPFISLFFSTFYRFPGMFLASLLEHGIT